MYDKIHYKLKNKKKKKLIKIQYSKTLIFLISWEGDFYYAILVIYIDFHINYLP